MLSNLSQKFLAGTCALGAAVAYGLYAGYAGEHFHWAVNGIIGACLGVIAATSFLLSRYNGQRNPIAFLAVTYPASGFGAMAMDDAIRLFDVDNFTGIIETASAAASKIALVLN